MITIGITGGIGSGKSVVSKLLEINGIAVYDSDMEAKRLTATSPVIREKLTERFGTQLYLDGQLDKAKLASLVFTTAAVVPEQGGIGVCENQPAAISQKSPMDSHLAYVNSVIHPEVARDFIAWKEQNEQENARPGNFNRGGRGKPARAIALESAILFESGFDKLVDVTVTVDAPLQVKIDRVKQRDNLSEQAVCERISNQMPDEKRNRLADYVIANDGQQALIPQVEDLLRKIEK
ncbi:dephospho-CoA kinase [Bacteroidia bacterium]|nr:dephospho-CoA kinase [Bacteroidia bacterium]